MILVDSNVLIDVLGDKQAWRDWSIGQLASLAGEQRLIVNQIAFAEVAPRMSSVAAFRKQLKAFEIDILAFAEDSAYVAGVAFQGYLARRPEARMVLPDFFIGGHALILKAAILTRDPRFYRAYFPTVSLITPAKIDQ
ncbi:MAG: type II toxin-antitoxin system VapC family toxin [Sphingomonadaceae bacterium]